NRLHPTIRLNIIHRRPNQWMSLILLSMILWRLTEPGLMSRVMAAVGSRQSSPLTTHGSLILTEAAGFTPTAAGTGNPIIPGVGLHFTMAAGFAIPTWAGAGLLIPFGALPG